MSELINNLQKSIPDSFQKKGLDKISDIVFTKVINNVEERIKPQIEKITNLLPEDGICPSEENITLILEKRNNTSDLLNSLSNSISSTLTSVDTSLSLINIGISTISTLKTTASVINRSLSFIPSPPGTPGALLSGLNELNNILDNRIFDNLGNSKLQPKLNQVNNAQLTLSLSTSILNNVVGLLDNIDLIITPCLNQTQINSLNPINSLLRDLQNQQVKEDNLNIEYKGFILEISKIKFNEKLDQFIAVAINKFGIEVLRTQPSFTTTPRILIDELKFIIDRDNLKSF